MGFWEWGKRKLFRDQRSSAPFLILRKHDSHSREPPKIFDSIHWTSFRFEKTPHLRSRALFAAGGRSSKKLVDETGVVRISGFTTEGIVCPDTHLMA